MPLPRQSQFCNLVARFLCSSPTWQVEWTYWCTSTHHVWSAQTWGRHQTQYWAFHHHLYQPSCSEPLSLITHLPAVFSVTGQLVQEWNMLSYHDTVLNKASVWLCARTMKKLKKFLNCVWLLRFATLFSKLRVDLTFRSHCAVAVNGNWFLVRSSWDKYIVFAMYMYTHARTHTFITKIWNRAVTQIPISYQCHSLCCLVIVGNTLHFGALTISWYRYK